MPIARFRRILCRCAAIVVAVAPAVASGNSRNSDSSDATDDQTPAALEARFENIAAAVAPSVVAISASTTADVSPAADRVEEMSADSLATFLSKTTRMVGTGFVISTDGFVLTNDHVIDDAQQFWVTTDAGVVYPAVVVGSDPRADLAVLKIPGHHLAAARLDPAVSVRRGQWSLAMGNPFGLSGSGEMSLSVGVVSATHRSLPKLSEKQNRLYGDLIQTTAQINPGNSGGPLFDLQGRVIGVNAAVIMPQKSVNGIGFALPVDDRLVRIVDRLERGEPIAYGYLGVVATTPTDLQRRTASASDHRGARIDIVQPLSPAEGLLLPGDLVLSIDDIDIFDSVGFSRAVADAHVGRPVKIQIRRGAGARTVQVTLQKRPLPATAIDFSNQQLQWAGMVVGNTAPADQPGLRVISVRPDSPFFRQGLREGLLIRTIAGRPVENVIALQTLINDTPFADCGIEFESDLRTAALSLDR